MSRNTSFYPNLLLDRNRERRVVFYGRVSTEHEAQISALENQMQWYDTQAQEHKNWIIVGRYIDEGITGTQAKKRPAFLNMIEDAKKGKFDLIVTREVCRFARNTVDTLVTTRELRNYGIEVYFVEDNIWTMDGDGELRLTIMATLAQEESRKVSERVKAGQQISREKGMVYGCGNILGYTREVGGTYEIDEEQAETVRLIYKMYVEDKLGSPTIAKELERLGRKTASGGTHWHPESINLILKNSTYTGTQAYGKSFSNNYLEQKRIQNRDRESYMYKKCDYEPIISDELYLQAQAIRESKVTLCYSAEEIGECRTIRKAHRLSQYIWARKVVDDNNVPYARHNWDKNPDGSKTYCYMKRLPKENGRIKWSESIPEWRFEMMGEAVIDYISNNIQSIATAVQKDIESRKSDNDQSAEKAVSIERLKTKLDTLLKMRVNEEITAEEYKKMKKETESELKMVEAIGQLKSLRATDQKALSKLIQELKIALAESNTMHDAVERLVSKIIPDGKTWFNWYINIGGGEITIPVEANGRKKNATVTIHEDWKNQI
jgi:DNA invertase Pin-like site-specific DNA recombinase